MRSGRWRVRVPYEGGYANYGVYDTEAEARRAQGRWANTHLLPGDDPAATEPLAVTAQAPVPKRCDELFEEWQEAKAARSRLVRTRNQRGGAETTAQRDRDCWRAQWSAVIGDAHPVAVTAEDITGVIEYLEALGRSPNYIRTHWIMIAAFFNWLADRDVIPESPIKGQSIHVDPAGDRVREIVVPDFRFIDMHTRRLRGQDRLIFELLLGTAGRRSEVAGLRVGDVDLGAKRVWIREPVVEPGGQQVRRPTPKGGQARCVIIGPQLSQLLKEHLLARGMPAAQDPLVLGPRGGMLRWNNYLPDIFRPAVIETATRWAVGERKRLIEQEGYRRPEATKAAVEAAYRLKKLSPHHLRHTAAALMWAAGATDIEVQLTLGHWDLSTSRRLYAHLLQGSQDNLAARVEQLRLARSST
jgi:integrase